MKKTFLFLWLSAFLLSACGPRVISSIQQSASPLDYREDVLVLQAAHVIPEGAQALGSVEIKDSGFSMKCNYDIALAKAKEEARKAGGNAIQIIEHKLPDLVSSCHRITANVYSIENKEQAMAQLTEVEEIVEDRPYALLHVFRNPGVGGAVAYNLYLGDSLLCRVKPRSKYTIKIPQQGSFELWAKTESKASVEVDIQSGRDYYLQCQVGMGVMVGRPVLTLVDSGLGKSAVLNPKLKTR
jgi:hypothetical protein